MVNGETSGDPKNASDLGTLPREWGVADASKRQVRKAKSTRTNMKNEAEGRVLSSVPCC